MQEALHSTALDLSFPVTLPVPSSLPPVGPDVSGLGPVVLSTVPGRVLAQPATAAPALWNVMEPELLPRRRSPSFLWVPEDRISTTLASSMATTYP